MYPKFLFHKEEAAEGRLVKSEEEEAALGEGWVDTPAKFNPKYVPPPPVPEAEGISEEARRSGFVPQKYPTTRYRKNDPDAPRSVASAEEDAALEADEPGVWKDTPDPKAWDDPLYYEKRGAKPHVRPTPPAAAVGDAPSAPAPDAPPVAPAPSEDEQRKVLYGATVSELAERISAVADPAVLERIVAFENENPRGARKTVLLAVKARLAELKVPA